MIWLPLVLLRATPAYLPVPQVARIAICDLDGGAADGGSSDSGSSSGSSGSLSGSSGSSSGSGGSTASASTSSGGTTTSPGTTGTTASTATTGGILGNTSGDEGESQDFGGRPSRCNTGNDCPNLFECVQHKCQPMAQYNVDPGGCASAPGVGWAAALVALGAVLLRRRRR